MWTRCCWSALKWRQARRGTQLGSFGDCDRTTLRFNFWPRLVIYWWASSRRRAWTPAGFRTVVSSSPTRTNALANTVDCRLSASALLSRATFSRLPRRRKFFLSSIPNHSPTRFILLEMASLTQQWCVQHYQEHPPVMEVEWLRTVRSRSWLWARITWEWKTFGASKLHSVSNSSWIFVFAFLFQWNVYLVSIPIQA